MSRRSLFLALLAPSLFMTCGQAPPKPTAARPLPTPVIPAAAPPFTLTASDGSGLRLVALEARGVVEGPLAMTELHLSFQNPEARTREGTFQIALPEGGAVSRFAMKVGDTWQEGEVVERQRARQIYEDFLHRRQDPALLEQEAGNAFSARVFPIPANATKEIILTYTQELTGSQDAYTLPLLGLPAIDRVDLSVLVSRASAGRATSNMGGESTQYEVLRVQKQGWTPDQDLVVTPAPGAAQGLRAEDLVVARVKPEFKVSDDPVGGLYVMVDMSASRALGLSQQIAAVDQLSDELARRLGADRPFAVAAYDQGVTPIFSGKVGAYGAAESKKLEDLMALGASDPGGAMVWLKDSLKGAGKRYDRVLVVTDGVATAGEREGDALRTAVSALGEVGVKRLDVLAVGGIRDDAALKGLVTAGLASDGVVIPSGSDAAEVGRRMTLAVASGIEVVVPGSEWSWPETLDAMQPGDEALVYAGLPARAPFSVKLDGVSTGLSDKQLAQVSRPLLERASTRARIDRLVTLRDTRFANDKDLQEAMKQQAIQLSLRHRVLSPWTALLVLETEQDYVRYGLDRNALADILTVGPTGIEVVDRRRTGSPVVVTTPPPTTVTRTGAADEKAKDSGPVVYRRQTEIDFNGVEVAGAQPSPSVNLAPPPPPPPPPPSAAPEPMEAAKMVESLGYADGAAMEGGAEGEEETDDAPAPADRDDSLMEEESPASFGRASSSAGASVASSPAPRATSASRHAPTSRPAPARREAAAPPAEDRSERAKVDPWTGPYKEVMDLLVAGRKAEALARARAWRAEAPGDVLALLALGAAFQANGDLRQAARCYGSLIDLFPSRADIRRTAGNWLEGLGSPDALALAVDTYREAVVQRPDHPNSHRMLAYALLSAGRPAEAFDAIEVGAARSYPDGRFAAVDRILREDMGIIAAVWLAREPAHRDEVYTRLYKLGAQLDQSPSLRFVLSWETDANDVDFHIYDGKGGHAFYEHKELGSGGSLYADVTTGYGPECFAIVSPRAFPYKLQAHYYSRGPMGFGMGTLVALQHDGKGGIVRQSQPFVVMNDEAFLDLGVIKAPLR